MSKIGVYILKGDLKYYVGSTLDLERRLAEHQSSAAYATKRMGKLELLKFLPCATLAEARGLEREIKKSKNTKRWLVPL